jgi:hypothetical protein
MFAVPALAGPPKPVHPQILPTVVPAKAGTQSRCGVQVRLLDSRFRGNDEAVKRCEGSSLRSHQ